ncbi:MAG TPA: LptA/OstA family protein [Xanthobacteraceae bacterium]|jgi:lipopolysaccharide export system protein LptA
MRSRILFQIFVAAAVLVGASTALAQTKQGGANLPSAFQGFARDNKEPVKIEANAFEVHDKDRFAVFIGNVVVQQGESTMRSRELKVFYEGSLRGREKGTKEEPAPASKPAAAGGNDPAQRIRRLEAHGGVIITNKDQKASGDLGVLDMPTNTATITGNVVLTQGPNVMRGDKLVVDLKTGYSRLESGSKDGNTRVQGLFVPSSVENKKSGGSK